MFYLSLDMVLHRLYAW